MEETGKVGIARFVMRSKQYLCAIRPKDGKLLLSTMVYADEVNDSAEIKEYEAVEAAELNDKELTMAKQLVESLSGDFQPEQFHDTYREKVLDLIERKASGEALVEVPEPEVAEKVVDLMAALEASVAAAKAARKRHPANVPSDGAEAEEEKPAAKKAAPRKRKAS
jgi:DNA end-binding protein Ku